MGWVGCLLQVWGWGVECCCRCGGGVGGVPAVGVCGVGGVLLQVCGVGRWGAAAGVCGG